LNSTQVGIAKGGGRAPPLNPLLFTMQKKSKKLITNPRGQLLSASLPPNDTSAWHTTFVMDHVTRFPQILSQNGHKTWIIATD